MMPEFKTTLDDKVPQGLIDAFSRSLIDEYRQIVEGLLKEMSKDAMTYRNLLKLKEASVLTMFELHKERSK
jgi:hypothetical protein